MTDDADGGKKPMYYATVDYKRWVRERLKKEGWTLREFAARVTRAGYKCSDEALWQLIGALEEEEPAAPSNTTLMPGINKVLGAAPPPVCNPDDELAQLQDMIADRWMKMTPRDRRVLLEIARGDVEPAIAEGTAIRRKVP